MYVKIFNSIRSGSILEIVQDQNYKLSSTIDGDIIVPELPNDYFISFIWNKMDGSIRLTENVAGVAKEYLSNLVLDVNDIKFPLFLSIESVVIGFGSLTDLENLPEKEVILNDTNSNKSHELIFEESILQNFAKKCLHEPRDAWKIIIKNKVISLKIMFVILLTLLIFITGILFLFHRSEQVSLSNSQVIKLKFQHLPTNLSSLKLKSIENNKYEISGVIESASDLNIIHSIFDSSKENIRINVIIVADAINKTNQILRSHQQPYIHSEYNRINKQIALVGFVQDVAQINDILIDINNQLPMLYDIDTSGIYSINDISTELQSQIKELSFESMISLEFDWQHNTIKINGYLSEDNNRVIQSSFAQIQQKYQGSLIIEYNIHNSLDAIPFKIADIFTGSPAYIQTVDGVKIFEGGNYKGISVKNIDQQKVTLQGKFPIIININDSIYNTPKNIVTKQPNRTSILLNEQQQNKKILEEERYEVDALTKIADKADSKLYGLIQEQISTIESDIKYRESDELLINKSLNG